MAGADNKGGRGGARPGSGRKPLPIPNVRRGVSIYLTEEQWVALEEGAAKAGFDKVGSFINEWAEKKANQLLLDKPKGDAANQGRVIDGHEK